MKKSWAEALLSLLIVAICPDLAGLPSRSGFSSAGKVLCPAIPYAPPAGMMVTMAEKKATLDYATTGPAKHPRFLEKLNPKATWRSVARKAIISCLLAAAAWWLLRRLIPTWHPAEWWPFVCWEVAAAMVGAVTEWQPID